MQPHARMQHAEYFTARCDDLIALHPEACAASLREVRMPASVVQTHCIDCHHNVDVPAQRVSLITAAGITTYGFECPRCKTHTIRVASSAVLAAFARGGYRPRLVLLQPPLIAGEPPTGPAIDEDDLITLGLQLQAMT